MIFETNGLKVMCFQKVGTKRFQHGVKLMSACTALARPLAHNTSHPLSRAQGQKERPAVRAHVMREPGGHTIRVCAPLV